MPGNRNQVADVAERAESEPEPKNVPLTIDLVADGATWPEGLAAHAPRIAAAICDVVRPTAQPAQATAMIATDDVVARMNHQFRGKSGPTNVLSFPAFAVEDVPGVDQDEDGDSARSTRYLGDIVLAKETAIREAEISGLASDDHVTHLIVHGILHLLGYDHQTDADAERMETLEIEILRSLGIGNPYAEENLSRR